MICVVMSLALGSGWLMTAGSRALSADVLDMSYIYFLRCLVMLVAHVTFPMVLDQLIDGRSSLVVFDY